MHPKSQPKLQFRQISSGPRIFYRPKIDSNSKFLIDLTFFINYKYFTNPYPNLFFVSTPNFSETKLYGPKNFFYSNLFLVAKQLYEPLMSVFMYVFIYLFMYETFFFCTNTCNISAVSAQILMKLSR